MLPDQASQGRTHLHRKPGASLFTKQRPIEPLVFSNMLEEFHPYLRGMLIGANLFNCTQQHMHCFLEDLFHQVVFILIIAIERSSTHHRTLCNLSNSERLKTPLLDQINECLPQQLLHASHT